MSTDYLTKLNEIQKDLDKLNEHAREISHSSQEQNESIREQTESIREQTESIREQTESIREQTGAIREQTALLDWRLGEISWQLQSQTQVLLSIDKTLKTPTETLANEWRIRAEVLRQRGELEQAKHLFLRCLEPEHNPLDYRTYIGLSKTYEILSEPWKALEYYEKSLKHAPKSDVFDRRSYSYLLMSFVYKALGDHQKAYLNSGESIKYSPEYAAGHYHHARHCVSVSEYGEAYISLNKAVRASEQYYMAMWDKQFQPVRREIVEILADTSTDRELPTEKYHKAWFELTKQCASFGYDEHCIEILDRVVRYNPSYYKKVENEISLYNPIHEIVQTFLKKLYNEAKEKARSSMLKSEGKLSESHKEVSKAASLYPETRYGATLKSGEIYKDAEAKHKIAIDKYASGDYKEILEAKLIAEEYYTIVDEALNTATEEKEYYYKKRAEKIKKACIEFPGFAIVSGVLGWLLFGFLGCFGRLLLLSLSEEGHSPGDIGREPMRSYISEGFTGFLLGVCIALLIVIYRNR